MQSMQPGSGNVQGQSVIASSGNRIFKPIPGVLILGIGHKCRQGKDSAAQAMVESAPADVLRIGFADALYHFCRVTYGMKEKDATLLQKVGVSERARNPSVWIEAVYYKILDKKPKVVVIPDVRFINEAEFVKQLGGYLIKIDRRHPVDRLQVIEKGPERVKERTRLHDAPWVSEDRDPNHISETELDGYSWDLTITNRDLGLTQLNAIKALQFFRQKFEVEGPRV